MIREVPKYDAVIALGGGILPGGELKKLSAQRANKAIDLYFGRQAGHIIFSGGFSVPLNESHITEAEAMRDYAVSRHKVPDEKIASETHSLGTIGNACRTKTDVVEPQGFNRLAVVTHHFHVPRTLRVFRHVMGPDYLVDAVGVRGGTITHMHSELSSWLLEQQILRGTDPGDHEAVMHRNNTLHPRNFDSYRDALKANWHDLTDSLPVLAQKLGSSRN